MAGNRQELPQLRAAGTLSNQAAAELEQRILLGAFAAGERLPTESELAQMLGVSRTVVRDAIRTLAGRGLVSVRQGVGTVVTQATDASVAKAVFLRLMRSDLKTSDVVAARAALETQLVPLAASRATDKDVADLDQLVDELAAAISERQFDRARETHLRFHAKLIEAIRLPALTILLRPVQQIILLSWERPLHSMTTQSWGRYADAHRPIVTALRDRDETQLRTAMAEHFAAFAREPFPSMPAEQFRDSPEVFALLIQLAGDGTLATDGHSA